MFDTPFWICCVILSKETLASVKVMNHVHSVTFLHRYIVSVDNKFRKSYLLWKRGQSISIETVMQFTEEHVNKIFQAHRFLYCDKNLFPIAIFFGYIHNINFTISSLFFSVLFPCIFNHIISYFSRFIRFKIVYISTRWWLGICLETRIWTRIF